ncbi:MAG TPA: tetratricopeptide repeat protein, partial [Terriglobia bacterium]|nr:tetratricopeptide repeat protein [Terriglobia bacterium]
MLAVAAAVPYLNTLLNGFVYDDMTQVMNNPYIVNFHHLRQIFSTGVWSYVGQQGVSNYYRPMMTLGYLLCYQLFGKIAFGYHLVNLLLHVGVVCALFGLTLAMFRKRSLAFAAALIFALHPIHTESVAWIAAVTDLELALFYLLAFWFFVRIARPNGGRSERNFAAMVVCFILALLSKEQALTLPLLATLYEHGFREDRSATNWTQKANRYAVLWLLAGAYLLLRIRLLGAIAPVIQMPTLTWPQAFLSAFALTGHYVAKMLWPANLCAFYVFQKSTNLLDPRVLGGVGVVAAAVAVFVTLWKRYRMLSFGLLWFFITLAPVLNARWMAANVFAERYLYLPSAGFCWLLGAVAVALWQKVSRERDSPQHTPEGGRYRILQQAHPAAWALAGGFAVLAILCAARIVTRNRVWNNNVRLYTRTLAQQPAAYQILNNLGTVYWAGGKDQAAEATWEKALQIHPSNAIVLNNLGLVYTKKKKYKEAADYFIRAMRLKPAYTDPHLN